MVLEQQVVFVCNTAYATENVAAHEVVSVRAKAIDDLGIVSRYS